jgi:hypothetical protein
VGCECEAGAPAAQTPFAAARNTGRGFHLEGALRVGLAGSPLWIVNAESIPRRAQNPRGGATPHRFGKNGAGLAECRVLTHNERIYTTRAS